MIDKNLLMPRLIDNPFVEGRHRDPYAFGGMTCKSTAGFSLFEKINKPSEVELLPGILLDSPWQNW